MVLLRSIPAIAVVWQGNQKPGEFYSTRVIWSNEAVGRECSIVCKKYSVRSTPAYFAFSIHADVPFGIGDQAQSWVSTIGSFGHRL
ncbi:MAG: hypothetical protein CMQ45_02590 [Gammaproteobacteria bacterium]|nr:hypothetical protein [Gammaproteobacteria bacterium]